MGPEALSVVHSSKRLQSWTTCGRYRLSRHAEALSEEFSAEYGDLEWQAHYNIAPTQQVPVIRQDAKEPVRRLSLMRWRLVPYWAKNVAVGASMINARSETAATKPAFKVALQHRRCLVPADGFL
jgi:putative SOS response-associated peptidase YedK